MEAVNDNTIALRKVTAIVAKVLEIPDVEVSLDLAMYGHPKWDSLAQIDIILELEHEFDLTVDDAIGMRLTTVAEIAALAGALYAAR